jgi:hypothetical protein
MKNLLVKGGACTRPGRFSLPAAFAYCGTIIHGNLTLYQSTCSEL